MRLRADARRFPDRRDRNGTCRKCGSRLVLLPEDRRKGFCFDCYDPLEALPTNLA